MTKILLFLLAFFIATPAWAWHESYVQYPASGVSVFHPDNAAFEIGANKYFAAWVRIKRNTLSTTTLKTLMSKLSAGAYSWYIQIRATGDGNQPRVDIYKANDGSAGTAIEAVGNYAADYNIHSILFNYMAVADATSGLTLFVNGNNVARTATAVYPITDNASPLTIGNFGPGFIQGFGFGGNIYEAGIAHGDLPFITDSGVSAWSNDPTVNPLPFTTGVSTVIQWIESGLQSGASNGLWLDTTGSYVMRSGTYKPTYKVWKQLDPLDKVKERGHWRSGTMP